MHFRDVLLGISAIALVSLSTHAAAQLNGKTVSTIDFHGTAPDTTVSFGPYDTVVGPGVEVTSGLAFNFATVDFSDTFVRIVALTNQPFGYFELLRFRDTNGDIPAFTGVTIDPATNYAGFGAARLSFGADSIDVNLTGLNGLTGQQIVLGLQFAPVAAVPEPATSSALLAGLVAVLAARRTAKSRSRSAVLASAR